MHASEILRFSRWNGELQKALQCIEEKAFPPDQRYSREEMVERAARPGFEGILVLERTGQEAIAIMIVYRPETGSIYLDTLAVCRQGHGIGSALLRFLIRRCEASAGRNGIREIRLDTEGCTESPLRAYYQRFGFGVASEDRTRGNITMVRKVGQTA